MTQQSSRFFCIVAVVNAQPSVFTTAGWIGTLTWSDELFNLSFCELELMPYLLVFVFVLPTFFRSAFFTMRLQADLTAFISSLMKTILR